MIFDLLAWFADHLGPTATIIASAVAAHVAWRLGQGQQQIASAQKDILEQQRVLAADKFRFDLFEKRFDCFQMVSRLCDIATHLKPLHDQSDNEYDKLFADLDKSLQIAGFLFREDIRDPLNGLKLSAVELRLAAQRYDERNREDSATADDLLAQFDHAIKRIRGEEERIKRAFEPYLSFGHVHLPGGDRHANVGRELMIDNKPTQAELTREDAKRTHDRTADFARDSNLAALKNAEVALGGALLINGGAAISVLTFVGGLVTQGKLPLAQLSEVASTLMWFAWGAALAVAAMAVAYFCNYSITANAMSLDWISTPPYTAETKTSKRWKRAAVCLQVLGIALGAASIVFFVEGMFSVKAAIASLKLTALMPPSTSSRGRTDRTETGTHDKTHCCARPLSCVHYP
jgi:hypothetical protein